MIILINNKKKKEQGIDDFGIKRMLSLKDGDEYQSKEYLKAAYPKIPDSLKCDPQSGITQY